MRKLLASLLFMAAFIAPGMADENTPLLYNRTTLNIVRHAVPAPMPWQPAADAPKPEISFDVEVRDAMTLYNQKGWYNLSSPEERSGVLMAFSAPGIAPVVASAQYAPLDILLIDAEGKITQIIPNIMLSQLQKEIMPTKPVLAFLFLKGGICQSLSINPGDDVEYALFKKPPVVLSAPPVVAPVPAPVASAPAAPVPTPAPATITNKNTLPGSYNPAPATQPAPAEPQPAATPAKRLPAMQAGPAVTQ
jgi:uncharacterized membrane protein (UPF0127 family)